MVKLRPTTVDVAGLKGCLKTPSRSVTEHRMGAEMPAVVCAQVSTFYVDFCVGFVLDLILLVRVDERLWRHQILIASNRSSGSSD